ncbi:MAG: nucleotidyltransferase family protein [Novosphingobium sp.]|uniref:nucleotidyltransferase family protein n=1 Tax=Novosphingobium sp. TaxID=1874826 RepID=UPI0012D1F353|nr:nucleotidyltransferase family protein [Novosphingobium sp.]MPS68517.1 nucleotidyltransferase family protein [Novosphingobium sp.]
MNRAAIVLAAGSSRRFGGDKLSAPFEGEPLLFHAVHAARAAPVSRILIVARPDLDCGTWDGAPAVEVLRVESDALSDSLKAGIAALGEPCDVFVFLGDMPRLPHGEAARLADALGSGAAAMPCRQGRPGHPVLLSARLLPELAGLTGDEGAGRLLRGRDDVVFVECDDPAIHLDIDRPEDLSALSESTPPSPART